MTIFAGDSSLVSGITGAGPQLSFALGVAFALCATAVIAYNMMKATDSRDPPFELVRFAKFFPPTVCYSKGSNLDKTVGRYSATVGWICIARCMTVYGAFAYMTSSKT